MTNLEIGTGLVELCKKGNNKDAINTFYADNIVSIEAAQSPDMPDMPDMPRVMKGIEAIRKKNDWWTDNHEVHSHDIKGPFPHGEDRFATLMSYDITFKPTQERMTVEEVGVYTVENDKIIKEEFFYKAG